MRRAALISIVLLTTILICGQLLATTVYWTDRDGHAIRRGDPNLEVEPETLLTSAEGLSEPRGLGLDLAAGKMYFADNGTDKIRRANLDGTGVEDLVTTDISFPADVELDLSAGKIYWTDVTQREIRRANLDGTEPEALYSGLSSPYYFDLDVAGGKIYWAENYNTLIHVYAMDGSGEIETLDVGIARIRDVALDLSAEMIYWGDRESHTVQRSRLDGTGIETLFNSSNGLDRPHGLEVDPADGLVYWTDTRTYAITRGNMDGSGDPDVIYGGLIDAWDLELALDPIPEPSAVVLAIVGIAGAFFFRRRSVIRRAL